MLSRIGTIVALAAVGLSHGCYGELTGKFGEDDEQTEEPPAFEAPRDDVTLLAFHVRRRRIADIAGIAFDHPALSRLDERALELGAHDFSQGVRPALAWDASMLAMWVDAIEPICASEELHARFPAFPTDLPAFLAAAWGRTVSDADAREIWSSTALPELDEAMRYQATCLGVLSSLEVVAR